MFRCGERLSSPAVGRVSCLPLWGSSLVSRCPDRSGAVGRRCSTPAGNESGRLAMFILSRPTIHLGEDDLFIGTHRGPAGRPARPARSCESAQGASAGYRPPSAVHRPPSTDHRPPSTVRRPPSAVRRPPFTLHRPHSTVHRCDIFNSLGSRHPLRLSFCSSRPCLDLSRPRRI